MRWRALAATAAVLAAAIAAASWWTAPAMPSGAHVTVTVHDPDQTVWFDAAVHARPAHALAALEAAAARHGVQVEVSRSGLGCGAYVHAIGAHAEHGVHGWLFDIQRAGQAWQHEPPDAADCVPLADGDAVRWRYGTY